MQFVLVKVVAALPRDLGRTRAQEPGVWGLQALQVLMAQQSLWPLWWFPLQSPFHLCALGGSIRKQRRGWPESSPHRDPKKNIYNSVKTKYKTSTVL